MKFRQAPTGENFGCSASVESNASQYDWALWHAELEITQRGPVEFVSKATDARGNTQPPLRELTTSGCLRLQCLEPRALRGGVSLVGAPTRAGRIAQ